MKAVIILACLLAFIAAFANAKRMSPISTLERRHKILRVAEQLKGDFLSDSELRCVNNCKKGMMCAAVCLPQYEDLSDLTRAEINTFFKKLGTAIKEPKGIKNKFNAVKDVFNGNVLSESTGAGDIAANWARAQVGKGYSQGQRLGPNSFDCSGLVYMAWKAAGVDIGATYTGAYPGRTRQVSNLQVGDILWRSGHVGIYVGNNQVVNAENPKSGVQIRSLDWYGKYMGYTKIYRP